MEDATKKRRGRPTVFETHAPGEKEVYKTSVFYDSERAYANQLYYMEGFAMGNEVLGEDAFRALFFTAAGNYKGKSIIEQIGRMSLQNGYSREACEEILHAAIKGMEEGYTIKFIEKWIRHGRTTGKFEALEAASNISLTHSEIALAAKSFEMLRRLLAGASLEKERGQASEAAQYLERHEIDTAAIIPEIMKLQFKLESKLH